MLQWIAQRKSRPGQIVFRSTIACSADFPSQPCTVGATSTLLSHCIPSPLQSQPDLQFRVGSGIALPVTGEHVSDLSDEGSLDIDRSTEPRLRKAGDIVRPLPAALRRDYRYADRSASRLRRWLVSYPLPRLRGLSDKPRCSLSHRTRRGAFSGRAGFCGIG
jgi:hypothetical protein